MRKVTVLSTKTNQQKEINTSATTWDQLRAEIESAGLSTSDMKAMVQETRTTLEHKDAVLPTGDFVLFLTPGKVKSGK